jgi:hypothetical protein
MEVKLVNAIIKFSTEVTDVHLAQIRDAGVIIHDYQAKASGQISVKATEELIETLPIIYSWITNAIVVTTFEIPTDYDKEMKSYKDLTEKPANTGELLKLFEDIYSSFLEDDDEMTATSYLYVSLMDKDGEFSQGRLISGKRLAFVDMTKPKNPMTGVMLPTAFSYGIGDSDVTVPSFEEFRDLISKVLISVPWERMFIIFDDDGNPNGPEILKVERATFWC